MRGKWVTGLVTAAGLALLGAGCGDDDDDEPVVSAPPPRAQPTAPEASTYVGEVEGTRAYIALVSDGRELQGYISDSKDVSIWIDRTGVSEGVGELLSRRSDELGKVTISGTEAEGEVTIDGEPHDFSAEEASGDAGLYRAAEGELGDPGSVEVGWVVLADDSERGGSNYINANFNRRVGSAPKLDPYQASVPVDVGGNRQLRARKFKDPTETL